MRRRLPLRLRVAAVFTLAAAVTLVALGVFVYYRVEATLLSQARTSLDAQMDAVATLPESRRGDALAAMTGEFFGQVLTGRGVVVASSPQLSGVVVPVGQTAVAPGQDAVVRRRVWLVEENESEAALLLLRRDGDLVLVVGTSKEDLDDALWGVRTQLVVGGPLALLLASGAGYLAAGTALRPIERMRRHADSISANSSGERLPLPPARDEIHRLGLTLNQMLDRLDAGLQRERRFVAEASHELRTPLALLKLELDLALAQPRSADELVAALRSAGEEVDRLTRLSEDLLLLAASQDAASGPDRTDVDVGSMLETLAARFAARALQEGRRLSVTSEGRPVANADAGRLERAVSNLVDNALRHGAGDVELGARVRDGQVSIRVTDQGAGMDDAFRARAFESFSRAPTAWPQDGRGLGLTIVHAIVAEHDGAVTIEDPADDDGTTVTITIPVAPAS